MDGRDKPGHDEVGGAVLPCIFIPAQAEIQMAGAEFLTLDTGFRRYDEGGKPHPFGFGGGGCFGSCAAQEGALKIHST